MLTIRWCTRFTSSERHGVDRPGRLQGRWAVAASVPGAAGYRLVLPLSARGRDVGGVRRHIAAAGPRKPQLWPVASLHGNRADAQWSMDEAESSRFGQARGCAVRRHQRRQHREPNREEPPPPPRAPPPWSSSPLHIWGAGISGGGEAGQFNAVWPRVYTAPSHRCRGESTTTGSFR